MKKAISWLMVFCITICLLPQTVLFSYATVYTGSCSSTGKVVWSFDTSSGELRISGNGSMSSYEDDDNNRAPWYTYRNQIKKIIIENGVTSIGSKAFAYVKATSISIPKTITSIGNNAFVFCNSLTAVYIDDLTAWCSIDYDYPYASLWETGHRLFLNGQQVVRLDIPKSVRSINSRAFSNCIGIKYIVFPDTITSIGIMSFYRCTDLKCILLPSSVTSIGYSAFKECNNLSDLTILNNNCTIDDYNYTLGVPSKTTIFGKNGSTAYNYANKYNYKFSMTNDAFDPVMVFFDLNGGSGNFPTQLVQKGGYVSCPSTTPTKAGYSFDGWYSNYSLTENDSLKFGRLPWFNYFNNYSGYPVSNNLTLYAKWKAKSQFTYGVDTYNFENSDIDFFGFWTSLSEKNYHHLADEYFDILASNLSDEKRTWLNEQINGTPTEPVEWQGSCFGMSAVLCLSFAERMDISFFQSDATNLYDLDAPKNSDVIFNLLEFYQFVQTFQGVADDYDETNETPNNKAVIDSLKESDYPVSIGIQFRDVYKHSFSTELSKYSHHRVVGYAYTESDNEYLVSIWDPNDKNDPNTLHISKDYTTSYFENNYDYTDGDHSRFSFIKSTISIESGIFDYFNLQSELQERGFDNGYDALRHLGRLKTINDDDEANVITVNYDSFTIASSNGANATVSYGVKTDGTLDISDAIPQNYLDQPLCYQFKVPLLTGEDYYLITPIEMDDIITGEPLEKYTTVVMNSNNDTGYYSRVSLDGSGTVRFFADGSIQTSMAEAKSHDITISRNGMETPWYRVYINGNTAGITVAATDKTVSVAAVDDTCLDFYVADDVNFSQLPNVPVSHDGVFLLEDPDHAGNAIILRNNQVINQVELGNTVIFYTLGGSLVDAQKDIPNGSCAVPPEDPTRTGFLFSGWYTNVNYEEINRWDFDTPITDNTRLYAKWRIDPDYTHTVTFRSDDKDDIIYVLVRGESLPEADIPGTSAPGDACYVKWSVDDFSSINEDLLITEVFVSHDYLDTIVAPTCTERGYTTHSCSVCGHTYVNTYVNALGHSYVEGVCQVCGDQVEQYSVTYIVPDTVEAPENTAIWGNEKVTLPILAPPEGFIFVGWAEEYISPTDTVPSVQKGGKTLSLTENKTYYAVFLYIDRTSTTGSGNYFKVLEEPDSWEGNYLIVCEDTGYLFDSSNASATTGYGVETVIESDPNSDAKWVSAEEGDQYYFSIAPIFDESNLPLGYTIKGTSGYYIYRNTATSTAYRKTKDLEIAAQYPFSISMNGITDTINGSRILMSYNSTNRFRFNYRYSAGYSEVFLYKKDGNIGEYYYTSDLALCGMIGHAYVTNTIAATQTDQGYDEHICSRCGDSYRDNYVDALGIAKDDSLKIKNASISLKSDISINFYVADSVLGSWSDPYIVFTKALYNSNGDITGYETETVTEFTQKVATDGTPCHVFRFAGIDSVEMGSAVTATIYATKNADGLIYEGKTVNYSVLTYATNQLRKTTDSKLRTLLVDLLNYGAAAQTYWNYNTANLANANLTAEQQGYATTENPELTNYRELIKNDGATVSFKTCSLSLEEKVTINYYLNLANYTGEVGDLELHISYVDTDEEEKTVVIDSSEFEYKLHTDGNYYYVVNFSGLNAIQMRTICTAEVFNKDSGERISNTVIYSIESYAQSKSSAADANLVNLVTAMMKYGDATQSYFMN